MVLHIESFLADALQPDSKLIIALPTSMSASLVRCRIPTGQFERRRYLFPFGVPELRAGGRFV